MQKTYTRTANSETEVCYLLRRPLDGGELRRRDGLEDADGGEDFGEEPGTAHGGWAEQ